MKKNLLILVAIVACSCDLVVDVNVPRKPPMITVNCLFTQDSTWQIGLFKSKYILDGGEYERIEDGLVVIYENDAPIDTLTHSQYGYYYTSSKTTPKSGMQYKLMVSAPGLQSVDAQSALPGKPIIQSTEFKWHTGQGNQSDFNYTIDVTFHDPADTEDYYEFELYYEVDGGNMETGYVIEQYYSASAYTDDPVVSKGNIDGIIFDDKVINGKEMTFRIKGRNYNGDNSKFLLVMRSLTKDLYQYRLSKAQQDYSSGDPFAQPVYVVNNIHNGLGIFAGYQEARLKIQP